MQSFIFKFFIPEQKKKKKRNIVLKNIWNIAA